MKSGGGVLSHWAQQMNFTFFSKTRWSEPPRIRHQLAKLLLSRGNAVKFFEKPDYPFGRTRTAPSVTALDGVALYRTNHLVHQQLRIGAIGWLNNYYEKKNIRSTLIGSTESPFNSVVVNFNFDYFFLREIFPDSKIVTIINDDFIAQARVPYKKHLVAALRATCKMSDAVLAVSQPLVDQLSEYCGVKLFLPWADEPYVAPKVGPLRDAVLFWGSVDRRLDMELIRRIAIDMPNVAIHMVGPQDERRGLKEVLDSLGPNVVMRVSTKLSDLPLDRYFAAIIPYKSGEKDIEAVSLSNKSLRLLAYGLPLVTHGMPYFIDSGAILKANSHKDFIDKLNVARSSFYNMQADAKDFVNKNTAETRYHEFMSSVV